MYKNKYLKYKEKYLHLVTEILVGGLSPFEKELIIYIKEEISKLSPDFKISIKPNIQINGKKWNWQEIKKNYGTTINMKNLFDFRKRLVDELINKIFTHYNCTQSLCLKLETGSVGADANLFSDYDLTITEQNFQATRIISTFNSVIQSTFNSSSFEVFDTNLYGYSALIPVNKDFKNKKIWLLDLFQKHYYIPTEIKNIFQDKWAIIRLITFIPKIKKIPIQINTNFYQKWITDNKNNNLKEINKIPIDQEILYIEKMRIFENLMLNNQDEKNINVISIREQIIESLSYMNFYGDETYFTIGSFMHVVGTMFYYREKTDDEKIRFLTEGQLIHSMIENLAYFIHNFDHTNNIIISIKYLERFMNAYKLLKKKQGVQLDKKHDTLFQLMNDIKNKLRNASQESILTYFKIKNHNDIKENIKKTIDKLKKGLKELLTVEPILNGDFQFYLSIMIRLLMSVITDINSNIIITFKDNNFIFTLNQ